MSRKQRVPPPEQDRATWKRDRTIDGRKLPDGWERSDPSLTINETYRHATALSRSLQTQAFAYWSSMDGAFVYSGPGARGKHKDPIEAMKLAVPS